MKKQQIRKIKEYAEKLLRLCEGETIPPFKLVEDGQAAHFEACERNAYEAREALDKAGRVYRMKVLAILEDDWIPIVHIFEDWKPQRTARLDEMRHSILCHTDPDKKYENWLEPRDDNLIPNEYLRSAIDQFADELLQEAEQRAGSGKTEQKTKRIVIAIVISLIVIILFELSVHKIPISWVTTHPNSYGLQGGIIFLIPSLVVGLLKPKWRKWCWGTAGVALLVLILSLLGGRSRG